MKTFKRFILSLSTLLLVSGLALAAPVAARDGTSGDSGSSGSGDVADASQTSTTTNDSTTGTETETEVETHATDLTNKFRSTAETELAAKKAEVKEHTKEERQKSCEARKTSLDTRMSNAVRHAQNHK